MYKICIVLKPADNLPVKKIIEKLQNKFGYNFCTEAVDTTDGILLDTNKIRKHWLTINATMQTIANDPNFAEKIKASYEYSVLPAIFL